jgi:hypothetical protein
VNVQCKGLLQATYLWSVQFKFVNWMKSGLAWYYNCAVSTVQLDVRHVWRFSWN